MKIVRNAGGDRVIDLVRPWLTEGSLLDLVTPSFSLFAFAELARELSRLAKARVVLPGGDDDLVLSARMPIVVRATASRHHGSRDGALTG